MNLIGRHIKQIAVSITDDKKVILDNGSEVQGDVIICSTGLRLNEFWKPFTTSTTIAEREKQLFDFKTNVKNAKSILLIGGGVVGVEMASELVTRFPNTEIHLVQGSDRLLPNQLIKSSRVSYNFLKKRKCKIYLNSHCIEQDDNSGSFILKPKNSENNNSWESKYLSNPSDPKIFKPDLVINCGGGKPVSDYFPSKGLNDKGEIKVDEYLQSTSIPGIFAIGDVNDLKLAKTGQGAVAQGSHCFENVLLIAKNKGKSNVNLKKFNIPFVGVMASLGYWRAVADIGGISFVGPFGTGSNTMRFLRRAIEKSFHDSLKA